MQESRVKNSSEKLVQETRVENSGEGELGWSNLAKVVQAELERGRQAENLSGGR